MDKDNGGGEDEMWEVGVGRVQESNGGDNEDNCN